MRNFLLLLLGAFAPILQGQINLTPGVTVNMSKRGTDYVCLPPGARCYVGVGLFAIAVPDSAQRMDIRIDTDAGSTGLEATMSFGKMPVKASSGAPYDGDFYVSTGSPGGSATSVFVRDGDKELRTGTSYIAVYAAMPFDVASGKITVTFSSAIGTYLRSVNNSASYSPYQRVSPGEIVVLRGNEIGPEKLVVTAPEGGMYPAAAGGTRVLFNGTPGALVYALSTQVAAVAPHSLVPGKGARIQVEYAGRVSNVLAVPVDEHNPGVFTQDSTGQA